MTDKIIVLTSCGSEDEANKLARMLIEKRLVACVNITAGVRSLYHWQGTVENSTEWMIAAKTRRSLLEPVSREIRQTHSYKVPEILAIAVVDGDEDYLQWIDQETTTEVPEETGLAPTTTT